MQIFPYLKVMNMIMNCSQEMSDIIPSTVIHKAFSYTFRDTHYTALLSPHYHSVRIQAQLYMS